MKPSNEASSAFLTVQMTERAAERVRRATAKLDRFVSATVGTDFVGFASSTIPGTVVVFIEVGSVEQAARLANKLGHRPTSLSEG